MEPSALAADIKRRGLVLRGTSFSSRHKGVIWDKRSKRWQARLRHGGKKEHLGVFTTEDGAKVRRDARCHELGIVADAGDSSSFRGVSWEKAERKWRASISIGGKTKRLGLFEATARGEVDAVLAYDAAARAAGRPKVANFEPMRAAESGPDARAESAEPAAKSLVRIQLAMDVEVILTPPYNIISH
jgi:hypothetical protein